MRTILGFIAAPLVPLATLAQQTLESVQEPEATHPAVITPTRLRQPLPDVPASVTIITAEQLRAYGITSVVEALRLVPGMAVTHASGNDWRVGYHGTNILTPRRMNVLIDGISVYRPGFARVFWQQLPVALPDIERIEVTRGPNSAAYGPNSMLAIVNIITRHPKDVERGHADLVAGSNGLANASVRLGATIGNTRLRMTASADRDGGYDEFSRPGTQGHDDVRMNRLNVRAVTALGPRSTLDLQAAYVEE